MLAVEDDDKARSNKDKKFQNSTSVIAQIERMEMIKNATMTSRPSSLLQSTRKSRKSLFQSAKKSVVHS